MHAHEICTWFLTNTHYYASEQTPWIDFFEQESAWSAVPHSAAIPEPTLDNEPELGSKEEWAEKARIPLFLALSLACYFKRPRLIQILLNRGAHPDPDGKYENPLLDPFKKGVTPLPLPLESMVAQRNVEGIKQLLERGAKVRNQTLLAALGDSSDETNPLLEALYTRCNKPVDAVYLLRKALWNRSLALINLLQRDCVLAPDQAHNILMDFMDITLRRQQSCTDAFAQALLKLLFEKGADANGLYKTNNSLLHVVVGRKSLDWTRWFLQQKADVEKKTGAIGRTPLQTACDALVDPTNPTPEECEMITLLLSYGAKPLLTGEDAPNSPYHLAQEIGAHSIVALFDAHLQKA